MNPERGNVPPDDSSRDDVDEVFAEFGNDTREDFAEVKAAEEEPISAEEYYGQVDSEPLQFQLRALFAALLLTGLFSMAYIYQRLFGFLLFFIVASAFAARAQGKRERLIATAFFGGAALLCGGLMMAESSRAPIAILGLVLACLGGYASLHGLALVISSFWE